MPVYQPSLKLLNLINRLPIFYAEKFARQSPKIYFNNIRSFLLTQADSLGHTMMRKCCRGKIMVCTDRHYHLCNLITSHFHLLHTERSGIYIYALSALLSMFYLVIQYVQ